MLKTKQRTPNQWRTPCTISLNYFSYVSEEWVFHRDWLFSKYLNPQRKWALLELNRNQGIFLRWKMFSFPDWCVSLVAFLLPFCFIHGNSHYFQGIWRFIYCTSLICLYPCSICAIIWGREREAPKIAVHCCLFVTFVSPFVEQGVWSVLLWADGKPRSLK